MTYLVDNGFNQQNRRYFKKFTKFTLPVGIIGTDQIEDMVSYSIISSPNPVTINQIFGAANFYSFVVSVKNMTTNVILKVEVEAPSIFIIENSSFELTPEETKEFSVTVDNQILNESYKNLNPLHQVTLNVTNLQNGTFAQIEQQTQRLNQEELPRTVDII